ncbi:hypothetical protein EXIGLDRAFT_836816 [Exidia glandulosa HHB12029]|uniref:Uncharacterized protein n=1 Tax=Exidia glandulosa HHB12029 TaxID=1314781 RepID=A0A165HE47_EXIGL|nr:hypothetical protein EXIGLDRAFT_836816 [Exidia glandulosa HHB12029]
MPSKPKKKGNARVLVSAHVDGDAPIETGPAPEQLPKVPKPSTNGASDPINIHRDRAKRWETTPYVAEWLANGVAYCKTPTGQAQFREWLRHKFPDYSDYERELAECLRKPDALQKFRYQSGGQMKNWGLAGTELDVSAEGLKMMHLFTATYELVTPERVKMPIKRRRGEPAAMWNARLHESLVNGSRMVDIDFEELRRIAISEFDQTRDTLEAWHTDVASVAHTHWSRAAKLFEELAARGLTTTTAIQRAYKADPGLKWRLLSCQFWSSHYITLYWSLACQVVVSQDAFNKFFKTFRDDSGLLHIMQNDKEAAEPDSIEAKVKVLFSDMGHPAAAYDALEEHFTMRPADKKKFGSYAWQLLGDVAVAYKFCVMFRYSSFGRRLYATADEVPSLHGATKEVFEEEFFFVDPSVVRNPNAHAGTPMIATSVGAQLCQRITAHVVDTWLAAVFDSRLDCATLLQLGQFIIGKHKMRTNDMTAVTDAQLLDAFKDPVLVPAMNASWAAQDAWLWNCAREMDPKRPGAHGVVAKTFGLFDPRDPARPVASVEYEEMFGAATSDGLPKSTPAVAPPAEPYVQSIPVANATDSGARSGHAAAREAEQRAPKEKEKTRGDMDASDGSSLSSETTKVGVSDEEDGPEYPEMLPSSYKLGKKNLNVIRQILGYKEQTAAGEAKPKTGVIRWEMFERTMRRIGFEIVQTAGSSVRFDPPAKTARPITFHRPHPDAILDPLRLKWVGSESRLKRCYGWSWEMFDYDPTLTDTS